MGIYSANRTGRLGVQLATLKENYTSADANRIMYECVVNDNKIFEAILANDFREIKSMREGTLLESERMALNEASIKELAASLKKHLSTFIGKIKSMIQTAITKISAYILRDGKAFVKNYREFMSKHTKYEDAVNAVKVVGRFGYTDPKDDLNVNSSEIEKIINDSKNSSDKINKSEVVSKFLAKKLNRATPCEPKAYRTIMLDLRMPQGEISTKRNHEITNLCCKTLEDASSIVKKLKDTEKSTTKSINQIANELKRLEKLNNTENANNVVKNITTLVSAGEQIVSIIASTQISIVKAQVSNARKGLGKLMAKVREEEKGNNSNDAVKEAAIDADAEIADAFDEIPGENLSDTLDPEITSEINDTVAAVEGKYC